MITAEDVRETLELALGNQPIPSGCFSTHAQAPLLADAEVKAHTDDISCWVCRAILTEVHESIDTESQASEDTANSLMLEAEHAPPAASQQVVANLLTNMVRTHTQCSCSEHGMADLSEAEVLTFKSGGVDEQAVLISNVLMCS